MSEKKLDKRVIRTRKLLRDSLMELILEKGYDAVTIQDIADRGGLGRATFYLHYKDKEDLLTQSLRAIIDELITRMDESDTEDPLDPPTLEAFIHASENENLYKVLLAGRNTGPVFNSLQNYIAERIGERIEKKFPFKPNIPIEIISQYQAGALLSMIIWWLESGRRDSAETMSNYYKTLTFTGFTNLT